MNIVKSDAHLEKILPDFLLREKRAPLAKFVIEQELREVPLVAKLHHYVEFVLSDE